MVHAFTISTQEAEAGESLSLRIAWSIDGVPGQSKLHNETLFQNKPNDKPFEVTVLSVRFSDDVTKCVNA